MKLLIRGGRLIEPSLGLDGRYDVLVEDGKVIDLVQGGLPKAPEGAKVYEAAGKVIAPGFIDIHVHLREPGQEYKEDIETGTRAAMAGGFTSVCCMANTEPCNDNAQVTKYILDRAAATAKINVFPIGAITKGLEGKELAEMGDMMAAGAVAFSDDGKCLQNAELMRRALEYARGLGAPVINHSEDCDLVGHGCMNEGIVSARLGLHGNPVTAEIVQVGRDIVVAEAARSRLHVPHASAKGSIDLVRQAKERGAAVTCEVTPHHLLLTEEAVALYNTNAKMAPPLRTEEDRQALCEALASGVIDCIATDHAPHSPDEKDREFELAPNGVIGMETALPVALLLVERGIISLPKLVERLTVGAARCIGLRKGTLAKGADADITVFDPGVPVEVNANRFQSKSRNCPFHGWKLKGHVEAVFCGGKPVWGNAA
ncbi:MAG: dihydroorotase [Bdellovibrionota bacterium]